MKIKEIKNKFRAGVVLSAMIAAIASFGAEYTVNVTPSTARKDTIKNSAQIVTNVSAKVTVPEADALGTSGLMTSAEKVKLSNAVVKHATYSSVDLGVRKTGSIVGQRSIVEGNGNVASGEDATEIGSGQIHGGLDR